MPCRALWDGSKVSQEAEEGKGKQRQRLLWCFPQERQGRVRHSSGLGGLTNFSEL